jgi:hypothetical protein
MRKLVFDLVYQYPTKHQLGFTNSEIEDVLKKFPNINREYYEKAMYGITCSMIDDEMVIFHCDVENALICGLKKTDLGGVKWD